MATSSTSSTSSSSSTDTGYALQSLGNGTPLQITGLSSGLDTDEIVDELMSIKQQPLTALQNQQSGLEAADTQLQSIQTALQTVASDAQALMNPSLFSNTQQVTSSNSTLVTATNSSGAGIGGYQVSVTQLANSAQRTFSYVAPTSADTITIDGQAVTISAGESASSLATAINANSNHDVYAAATDSGTLVFSNRQTGDTGTNFIQVSDPGGALTEQTSLAKEGKNAEFSVDGVSGTSSSNTVTNAIAGVTLTLNGVTTTAGPVTIDVDPPAPSTSAIQTALQQFVTDYNTAVSDIQTQLAQTPSSSSPSTGSLYDDQDLSNLLSEMRTAMVSSISGVESSMSNMLDLGVSTGTTTGSAAPSQSAIDGDLTLDSTTLTSAVQSDPTAVQQLLAGWSSSFATLVNNEAAPGGTIDQRVSANTSEINDLGQQISTMQTSLADQQQQLVNEFAAMESALSQNQSESSYLTSQLSQLTG